MPSPFPGMDPYLEDPAYWSDFTAGFLTYLCDFVNERLPDHFEARIVRKVNYFEASLDRIKRIEPDLIVSQTQPVTIPHLLIEEETHERWIEILHRPERSLVTVVELLSPSNKEEPGLHRYREKRFDLLMRDVHLVEIDLLLAGRRLMLRDPLPPADYYALVSRGNRRPECQVYHWPLPHALPTIPLPLKAPDPDLPLDLGAVFATTYDKGRYARSLSYAAPPVVRLSAETREWVLQQIRVRQS